ncbi:nuclease [Rhodococcus phage Mbo2]|uniref:Nuclease n=1 Tax=Rhodococcus phage Mbo2 TaxID=2936911 RepID=A0A9E7IMB5_9CAUD|nr:nuclease [Rhodococcus phage Mbo2]
MKPKTLSASSLQNWEDCPAKFGASNVDYIPEIGKKEPARVGTSVHYALEHFVRKVYMEKTADWSDTKLLLSLLDEGYREEFGAVDKASEWYKDALALTKDWHKRTNLEGREILAVEEKKRIGILPGDILLTYIFDRVERFIDEDGLRILKVTDYKTERKDYTHDALINKLQVRIYGLCAAIEFKEWKPDEIWVELDMLRFTPISVRVDWDDNKATWDYLQEVAQKILDSEKDDLPHVLGPGCRYCPIQAACPELRKSRDSGSVLSITDIADIVSMRHEISGQLTGLEMMASQLDSAIHAYAEETGQRSFVAGGHPVKITAPSRRNIDASQAGKIIGPDLMRQYGKLNITDVDKLLKGDVLNDEEKLALKKLIGKKFINPGLDIKPVPPIKG